MTPTAAARVPRAVAITPVDSRDRWRRFWLLVLVNAFVIDMYVSLNLLGSVFSYFRL